jgi:hypothetical protein
MSRLVFCFVVLVAVVAGSVVVEADSIINVENIETESPLRSEINSLLTTTPVSISNASDQSSVIEHVYTVNERETISLKCPIDFNSKQLKSPEYDQIRSSEEDFADSNAIKKPVISWFKDSGKINKLEQFSARYQIDGIYLKIRQVSPRDTGKFKCVIVSENGKNVLSSNIINLIVQPVEIEVASGNSNNEEDNNVNKKQMRKNNDNMQSGPSFFNSVKNQPSVFYKQKGTQVRLRCRASGSPRPNIIWYKNGDLINQEGFAITR